MPVTAATSFHDLFVLKCASAQSEGDGRIVALLGPLDCLYSTLGSRI